MSDDEARLQVLTHDECLELLRAGGVGRIAFDVDEFPVILPLNYRLVGRDPATSSRAHRATWHSRPMRSTPCATRDGQCWHGAPCTPSTQTRPTSASDSTPIRGSKPNATRG